MEYMPVEAEVSYRDQQSEKVTGIQQDCGEHIWNLIVSRVLMQLLHTLIFT